MSTAAGPWHLRTAPNQVFGPVDLPTLRAWAEEGRVGPAHEVSADRTHWVPAAQLVELGMEWEVRLPGASPMGPYHIRALRDGLIDGGLLWDTPLRNLRTGAASTVRRQAPAIFGDAGEAERLKAALTVARDDADAARREVNAARQQADAARREADTAREALARAEAKAAAAPPPPPLPPPAPAENSIRILELESGLIDRETRLSAAMSERDAARHELAALGHTHEQAARRQTDEAARLASQVASFEARVQELTSSANESRRAAERAAAELKEEQQRHQTAAAAWAARQAANEERDRQNASALDQLRAEAAALKAALDGERSGRIAAEERARVEADRLQVRIAGLETGLAAAQQAATEVKAALEAERGARSHAEARADVLTARMDAAEQRLAAANRAAADLQEALADALDGRSRAEAQAEALTGRIDAAEQRLAAARRDAEEAMIKERQANREALSASALRERELDEGLKQQIRLLEEETQAWEKRELVLQRKIDQLQASCHEAVQEARQLHDRLSAASEQAPRRPPAPRPSDTPLRNLEKQAQEEIKRWIKSK